MKYYTVEFEVDGGRSQIQIEAKLVLKISDNQIVADGMKITFPGQVYEIKF